MNDLQLLADLLDRADADDNAPVTWGDLRQFIQRAADLSDAYDREADQ